MFSDAGLIPDPNARKERKDRAAAIEGLCDDDPLWKPEHDEPEPPRRRDRIVRDVDPMEEFRKAWRVKP